VAIQFFSYSSLYGVPHNKSTATRNKWSLSDARTETKHRRLDLHIESSLFLPSVRLSARSTNDFSDVIAR